MKTSFYIDEFVRRGNLKGNAKKVKTLPFDSRSKNRYVTGLYALSFKAFFETFGSNPSRISGTSYFYRKAPGPCLLRFFRTLPLFLLGSFGSNSLDPCGVSRLFCFNRGGLCGNFANPLFDSRIHHGVGVRLSLSYCHCLCDRRTLQRFFHCLYFLHICFRNFVSLFIGTIYWPFFRRGLHGFSLAL